jgi:hypothetical protein
MFSERNNLQTDTLDLLDPDVVTPELRGVLVDIAYESGRDPDTMGRIPEPGARHHLSNAEAVGYTSPRDGQRRPRTSDVHRREAIPWSQGFLLPACP